MKFFYKAVNREGYMIEGIYDVEDKEQLWKLLRHKDYFLISCNKKIKWTFFNNKPRLNHISGFCNQLHIALKAGINIEKALDVIKNQYCQVGIRKTLDSIKYSLLQGESLYSSMIQYKEIYPWFMVKMINIGEQSGRLDNILKDLSIYYTKEYDYKKKLINFMIYPMIVLITTIIVSIFLLTNIVPIFSEMLISMGTDLPLITRIVMFLSSFVIQYKILCISIFFIILFLLWRFLVSDIGKKLIDKLKLTIPVVKDIYRYLISVRICRCLSILLDSGINFISALEFTNEIIDNSIVKKQFNICIHCINSGKNIFESMVFIKVLDPLAISMISMGEQTGNLDRMFLEIANTYEELLNHNINRALSLVEPIMMIIISILVGIIVVSMFMPILNLMDGSLY